MIKKVIEKVIEKVIKKVIMKGIKKVIKKVDALQICNLLVPYTFNHTAHKILPVPQSALYVIWDDLSCFIYETRQHRIHMIPLMIHQEACCLLPEFRS